MSAHAEVHGGQRIGGVVRASGFKHSLVTTIAAALVTGSRLSLDECPDIVEAEVLVGLLDGIGATTSRIDGRLVVDPAGVRSGRLDPSLVSRIHGAPYLLPGLLARTGWASIGIPGGCPIGAAPSGRRPIAHYAEVLERFGVVVVSTEDGGLQCATEQLTSCTIDLLDFTRGAGTGQNLYSGATKTALLAAGAASGVTTLQNPYHRTDVADLIQVLRLGGVEVDVDRSGTIRVCGPGATPPATPVETELVADLIEVVTWVTVGCLLADEGLTITGPRIDRAAEALRAEGQLWERMGLKVSADPDGIRVLRSERLRPVSIVVEHQRGIYSDSHPFFALLAANAEGPSRIEEQVWPDRFAYVAGLTQLGVMATQSGSVLEVHGPCPPHVTGERLHGHDLRSAAVLLLAALTVEGTTQLTGLDHLDRGYVRLIDALSDIGASITVRESISRE